MKYPRIQHIKSSHPTSDDLIIKANIFPSEWIVTEKIDGTQISFEIVDGNLLIKKRKRDLMKGNIDAQFHPLSKWIYSKFEGIKKVIKEDYRVFGEWLFHKHTIPYNILPDWFVAFDIMDKKSGKFINFYDMCKMVKEMDLQHVPILFDGEIKREEEIPNFIKQSQFSDEEMEGVVLHSLDGKFRYKYVTGIFREMMGVDTTKWKYRERTLNNIV